MVLATLLGPGMTVIRQPDPPPGDGTLALAPLVLILLVFTGLAAIERRRARRRGAARAGFLAGLVLSTALGNALMELNHVLDPSRPMVVQLEPAEHAFQAPGAPPQPGPAPPARALAPYRDG